MRCAIVLAALLVATTGQLARANVWEHAIALGQPDPAQDKYDAEMRAGDEAAIRAMVRGMAFKEMKNQLDIAVASYKAAALAKPNEAEPWFRLAKLLYSFHFDCTDPLTRHTGSASSLCDPTGRIRDKKKAEEVIAAWDAFEQRAPLDPRLSVGAFGDNEILFERAILHTKLATKAHLQAAATEYEKILARHDGDGVNERVLGNLAETYMMIGKMDEALETYRQALRSGSDTSTWYGYAVALDRDESTRHALDIIKSLGRDQRDQFHLSVMRGNTFFVPEGEKYYYFALVDEAFGFEDEAIDNWRKFISSGAHPEFQPRAKAHLEALMAKKKRRTALPVEPWPELFR